jgi:hypothetical protein
VTSLVSFSPDDVDAVEQGRRALHAQGNPEAAAQLSWLAQRMRDVRFAEIEQECHDIIAGRIGQYGHHPVRVQHLRSVS